MVELADILALLRWDRVLFSTYALSLSFFESFVIHHLRRTGCDEIWVIADAQGYQSSLMERRAWGAGHNYRLIPVALPKGVFHCKCAITSLSRGQNRNRVLSGVEVKVTRKENKTNATTKACPYHRLCLANH